MDIKRLLRGKKKKGEILEHIKSAHEELKNAEEYLNNVSDPELIDYGIYRLNAAKTHYSYLLNLARKQELNIDKSKDS